MTTLIVPARSKVTPADLKDEVEEYFALGIQLRAGDTVLDVGANVGAFAMRAAAACGGDLRILAFEPSPETFDALTVNFARSALLRGTRHQLFRLGLSSDEHAGRTLAFYDFARYPTNSTFHLSAKRREFEIYFEDRGRRIKARIERVVPGRLGRAAARMAEHAMTTLPRGAPAWWLMRQVMGLREHEVRVDTLANVLERTGADDVDPYGRVERIDLLKIDVEGPELEILQGLGASGWSKVRQVVVETHDRDGRLQKIEALVRSRGLREIRRARQRSVDNGLDSIIVYARRPESE
jgi:FkbM family methyltransferase